jgi:hypothetical protein
MSKAILMFFHQNREFYLPNYSPIISLLNQQLVLILFKLIITHKNQTLRIYEFKTTNFTSFIV